MSTHSDVTPRRDLRSRRIVPVAVVCSGLLLAGCTSDNGQTPTASSAAASSATASSATASSATASGATGSGVAGSSAPAGSPGQGGVFDRIPDVIQSVEPSVVTIFTTSGLGSGVIFGADGTIVTNEHVIHGAQQVQIAYADGQRGPGTVLASDTGTDLAVVRSQRKDLPPAQFQTQLPRVGDLAIALGSPLGFEGSATAGIISGLSREIPGSAQASTALVDLIQTDAPISPGNSGGALVGADGRVVGINDAYIPPSAGAVSLGFAIPSATVVDVVEQLVKTGTVRTPFVGIQPGRITPQIAQQLGLQRTDGVLVLDVVQGGPAATAGVQPGDVIVSLNGGAVRSVEDFLGALRPLEPGQTVPVGLVRKGAEQSVQLTLGATTR